MRVLIAEDDRVSSRVLQTTLVKLGYDVVVCSDGAQAWEVLKEPDSPQIAILDWMMPELDGLEVCRRVRRRTCGNLHALDTTPYVYIMLLTAKSQKTDLIAGLDAGADDYLTKPFDASELKVRLRAGQRIIELQSVLLAKQEELRHQASHDPLTGIYNRAAIMERLKQELSRSSREQSPLTVVMLDLDKFKPINDTHGHQAGDQVLCEIVSRIKRSIRPYDSLGRYGGDEFMLVLPNCGAMPSLTVTERIREVGHHSIMLADGHEVGVTLSIGTATTLGSSHTVESLIHAADAALYRAKYGGRDCVEQATDEDLNSSELVVQTILN